MAPILGTIIVLSYQSILIMRMRALYEKNLYLLLGFVVLLTAEAACTSLSFTLFRQFNDTTVDGIWATITSSVLPYPAAKGPCIVQGK